MSKKTAIVTSAFLFLSACQDNDYTLDKLTEATETINALFDHEEVRKLCQINVETSKHNLLYSLLKDVPSPPTSPSAGTLEPIPVKQYDSFKDFYSVFSQSFGLPPLNFTNGSNQHQLLDPLGGKAVSFAETKLVAGDIIVDVRPVYGTPGKIDYLGLAQDVVLNFVNGKIISTVSKVMAGAEIASQFLPSPKTTPEEYTLADYGLKGIEGTMMGIMGDVRQDPETKNWHATIINIDFTIGSNGQYQFLEPRVINDQLVYSLYQKNSTHFGTAFFNKLASDKNGLSLGTYGLIRHPMMGWVAQSGVCERCTDHKFCSGKWQKCMNDPTQRGFDLIKPMLESRQCETRCNDNKLSCQEKKSCLTEYAFNSQAAKALDCEDKDDTSFCKRYPQHCTSRSKGSTGSSSTVGRGRGGDLIPMTYTSPFSPSSGGGGSSTVCWFASIGLDGVGFGTKMYCQTGDVKESYWIGERP